MEDVCDEVRQYYKGCGEDMTVLLSRRFGPEYGLFWSLDEL